MNHSQSTLLTIFFQETKVALISRANQLKKAREDFFLGKESSPGSQPENSPSIARPTSLPIKLEKDHSNQGSPTSDKVTTTAVT